jgi:hypothetical protein
MLEKDIAMKSLSLTRNDVLTIPTYGYTRLIYDFYSHSPPNFMLGMHLEFFPEWVLRERIGKIKSGAWR